MFELTGLTPVLSNRHPESRGINLYSAFDLMRVSGMTRSGERVDSSAQIPLFTLDPTTRTEIFAKSDLIISIVNSRSSEISGYDVKVIPEKDEEDLIVMRLRMFKEIVDEYEGQTDIKFLVTRMKLINMIREKLPDLLPDLSNFDRSLIRWNSLIKAKHKQTADEILDWIMKPNREDTWVNHIKKWVTDLHVHGNFSLYKGLNEVGQIDYIKGLIGGTTFPLRVASAADVIGFTQVVDSIEPQVFTPEEIVYDTYMPATHNSYGMVPLDALVNKIAEGILFDQLMAGQADGTKPVEKVVVFADDNSIGDLTEGLGLPVSKSRQKRIEDKLNEARSGAIATLTGYGAPQILDLTRENTMSIQMQRQDQNAKVAGRVFNLSALEMSLTGGDDTSGRSTSESQERLDQRQGTGPIVRGIQDNYDKDIILQKFGSGYLLKFMAGLDDAADLQKAREHLESGAFDVNWVRTHILNEAPYPEEEFDRPPGTQQPSPEEQQDLFTLSRALLNLSEKSRKQLVGKK